MRYPGGSLFFTSVTIVPPMSCAKNTSLPVCSVGRQPCALPVQVAQVKWVSAHRCRFLAAHKVGNSFQKTHGLQTEPVAGEAMVLESLRAVTVDGEPNIWVPGIVEPQAKTSVQLVRCREPGSLRVAIQAMHCDDAGDLLSATGADKLKRRTYSMMPSVSVSSGVWSVSSPFMVSTSHMVGGIAEAQLSPCKTR